MRATLISWLFEVHLKFKLMPKTLYIAVNLLDRYCEKQVMLREDFLLVGVNALFIAAKYEEVAV